jgi:hypothetical protein
MILHWDRCANTDKTIVLNRPVIVLIYTENKTALLTDMAVSLIRFLSKIEREKITKYENFALEIKKSGKLKTYLYSP